MDRRGSGFKKIVEYYQFQQNYKEELRPIFYSNNNDFYIVLKNLNYNCESINDLEGDYQNVHENFHLNPETDVIVENILNLIKNNPKITLEKMAQMTGKSIKTIQRKINGYGKIKYTGSSKNGYWIITQNVHENVYENVHENVHQKIQMIVQLK